MQNFKKRPNLLDLTLTTQYTINVEVKMFFNGFSKSLTDIINERVLVTYLLGQSDVGVILNYNIDKYNRHKISNNPSL